MDYNTIAEETIKAIVRAEGVSGLETALNNAFSHGEILQECYSYVDEKALAKIFKGIKQFGKAAKLVDE